MVINQCSKGKRVEREIAQWLRENGYPSARRSQQFNGGEGLADIVADEPAIKEWHIESKGTKLASLKRSQLLDWYDQVDRDCPENMNSVVINQARGKPLVALLPLQVWNRWWDFKRIVTAPNILIGGSYSLYDSLNYFHRKTIVANLIGDEKNALAIQVVFAEVESNEVPLNTKVFACMLADDWIKQVTILWALRNPSVAPVV